VISSLMAFLCAASSPHSFAFNVSAHGETAVLRVPLFADQPGFLIRSKTPEAWHYPCHAFGNFAGRKKFLFFENRKTSC